MAKVSKKPTLPKMSRPIKREAATKKLNERKAIVSEIFCGLSHIAGNNSVPHHHFEPISNPTNGNLEQRNGFVFSRDLVLGLFFGKNIPTNIPANSPEALIVVLGAHFQSEGKFKKGAPTAILMGANKAKTSIVKGKSAKAIESDFDKYSIVLPSSIGVAAVPRIPGPNDVVGIEFPPSLVMSSIDTENADHLDFHFLSEKLV